MTKGNLFEDTFEQLVELGSSTAKKSVQQIAATFNPLNLAKKLTREQTSEVEQRSKKTAEIRRDKDHTPLDFKKLQAKFDDRDKLQAEALRNRLFQIVKREDEKSLEKEEMEEVEIKRKEEYIAQDKKRKEQEKKQQQGDIPTGKIRRSIFSSKKTVDRQHAELKPATGKQ